MITTPPPRPRWPSQMPIGQPITQPSSTAQALIVRCSHSRSSRPPGLVQFSGSLSQTEALLEVVHDRRSRVHGVSSRPTPARIRSRTSARADTEDRAGEDLRLVEVVPEAAQDQVAEPALADQRADRDQGDRGDRGQPQAGDDAGQRQRQLDPQQPAEPPVSHAGGRVAHLVGHLGQTGQRVAHQDQQRVEHQGDQHRGDTGGADRRAPAARAAPATESCRGRRRVRESARSAGGPSRRRPRAAWRRPGR